MRRFFMRERLTWNEMLEKYPNQWVRLEDVETPHDNDATILSAVVTKVGITGQDEVDANRGLCRTKFLDDGANLFIGAVSI